MGTGNDRPQHPHHEGMPTKAAARRPRKTTAPTPIRKTPPAKITARNLSGVERELPQTEIIGVGETDQGYSFIALVSGKGVGRRFWWHCGGCWQDSADAKSTSRDDMAYDLGDHTPLCPGAPYRAQIRIVWADGHPPTNVRI